jgi:predicted DNA binding CopG/RHH family protein
MKKEYDFSKLKRAEPKYLKHLKEPVTMRLDPQVISYFKKLASQSGVPYQSLINFILKDYVNKGLHPQSGWPR